MENEPKDERIFNHIFSVVDQLTPDQQQCVLDLNREWMTTGFSVIHAALLWATDGKSFPGRFASVVERRPLPDQGNSAQTHQYRLTPLGEQVQAYLNLEK